jgi:hypothetical protein
VLRVRVLGDDAKILIAAERLLVVHLISFLAERETIPVRGRSSVGEPANTGMARTKALGSIDTSNVMKVLYFSNKALILIN